MEPQTVQTINGITSSDLWTFTVILFLLCGASLTILSLVEKVQRIKRDQKKPIEDRESGVMDKLATDKRRLDAQEREIA